MDERFYVYRNFCKTYINNMQRGSRSGPDSLAAAALIA